MSIATSPTRSVCLFEGRLPNQQHAALAPTSYKRLELEKDSLVSKLLAVIRKVGQDHFLSTDVSLVKIQIHFGDIWCEAYAITRGHFLTSDHAADHFGDLEILKMQ